MESGKCVRAHYEAMQVAPGALWGKCSELRPGALGSHASAPGSAMVPRKCAREHFGDRQVLPGARWGHGQAFRFFNMR